MTYPLPVGTSLGDLKMSDTLLWYDGPKLFTCRASSRQRFIVVLVDDDVASETYMFAPITRANLRLVLRGKADLRQAFMDPAPTSDRCGQVAIVVHASSSTKVTWRVPADLDQGWFHDPDTRLN